MAFNKYAFGFVIMAAILTQRTQNPGNYWSCDSEADINLSWTDGYLAYTQDNGKWWKIINGVAVNIGTGFNNSSTNNIPAGGSQGQVLAKKSATDFEYEWVTPAGGPGGSEPTGVVKMWPVAVPPAGYLLCDGAAVSRTTYAALFALLSTTYGIGDGLTTFNLPNSKGRAPVGMDAAQTEFDALGKQGGAKTHTLVTAEIPAHNHVIRSQTATTGSATSYEHGTLDTSSAETEASETTDNAGGGQAHNNLQPYLTLNFIIKT
jgi:microcystin-dependent protein